MDTTNYINALKALADENRLKIVELISNQTLCACDLLDNFSFTQPTLSHHMKVLEDAGIVESYKEGKWKHYSLKKDFSSNFLAITKQILSGNGDSGKSSCNGNC
ncbi:ArsR/SmtB family transcription factor [Companilactobacillus ginsenosidimutans]|uniref:HTH arsR-type domain-containing protein n=1 Tax=Companilactobacillus ginsenosidimutans TaxID=1007676 RepID=A0A0H4R096_9LACO|nr:metalloregulator ArsR/SmtB family transcription factor [Companilactobacillus ginsenosidimutans]AKP67135.1 hypothetical protein ABM34_06015 [Companilactobacillus ginsenosidimutans]